MAAFRRLAESTHFAGLRSSSQKEMSTSPSNQISRRGYHIDLGAREKALEWYCAIQLRPLLCHPTETNLCTIHHHLESVHLLEEDPALKRFKSYKNNLKRVSKIGDVLTILVVAACTYELYAVATVRKDQRQQH